MENACAAEQLFWRPPEHDVIVGALADKGLVAVVLPKRFEELMTQAPLFAKEIS